MMLIKISVKLPLRPAELWINSPVEHVCLEDSDEQVLCLHVTEEQLPRVTAELDVYTDRIESYSIHAHEEHHE